MFFHLDVYHILWSQYQTSNWLQENRGCFNISNGRVGWVGKLFGMLTNNISLLEMSQGHRPLSHTWKARLKLQVCLCFISFVTERKVREELKYRSWISQLNGGTFCGWWSWFVSLLLPSVTWWPINPLDISQRA